MKKELNNTDPDFKEWAVKMGADNYLRHDTIVSVDVHAATIVRKILGVDNRPTDDTYTTRGVTMKIMPRSDAVKYREAPSHSDYYVEAPVGEDSAWIRDSDQAPTRGDPDDTAREAPPYVPSKEPEKTSEKSPGKASEKGSDAGKTKSASKS